VVIVVGSPTSSNSNRLREVAENLGVPAYMVDNASEIDPQWVSGKKRVGVTAGASAPESPGACRDRAPGAVGDRFSE
jgi:4-hydroxy-3-methylbut-2-enyl diphosphate reductase